MFDPIFFLRNLVVPQRLSKPTSLSVGSIFALGSPAGTLQKQECLWHVRNIRPFLGIQHALIEQCATGKTKTVAVSAIVRDQSFQAR
jgi:hypothetical protein